MNLFRETTIQEPVAEWLYSVAPWAEAHEGAAWVVGYGDIGETPSCSFRLFF